MFVSRLYIKNFRSIKELDLQLRPGKNVIVGRNNAGKSNIVKALDILLGEASPDHAKSENVGIKDFHTCAPEDGRESQVATEIFLWCELTREHGEVLNYPELYKCYGFYRCCRDNRHGPSYRFDTLPEAYADAFDFNEDEWDGKFYVNPKLRNQQTLEGEFGNKYCFAIGFKATREDMRVIKDARMFYRESQDVGWIMAFKARVRTELLQSAIIPSFRDPQQQLRLTNWTWYGKLIRHLTVGHPKLPALKEKFGEVHEVADEIFEHMRDSIGKSALNVAFPDTEIYFHLNPDAQLDLYKACLIYVDDGFKSLLTEKGSGIQSATIIGLFTYYTTYVNTATAALLCIEEPEVYLHPHARRVISERLNDFLGERNQVILTTHSVEFLQNDGTDLNVIVTRHAKKNGTTAINLNLKEYSGVLVGAASEVFFADKVVVCEGFDDYIVRAAARELFPKLLDSKNVSVVSVGGKDNVAKMAKLVRRLNIECYILADFDYFLRDRDERCKAYQASQHDSIEQLGVDFFCQDCLFGSAGQDVFRSVRKLRAEIKRDQEDEFYTASKASSIKNGGLTPLLTRLRNHGICILSGEIEDCCIDGSFHNRKKLSLERIFSLNNRLVSGERILDIFDFAELSGFLAHLFV